MNYNKTRPAPSKAALRVLYQLAYISSGTLVGAAALCAEERRRKIQIVQRIAENARRIRQSPRYNHHAAASVSTPSQDGSELWAERQSRSNPDSSPPISYSAPYLPSAVTGGYDRWLRRRKRRDSSEVWKDANTTDTIDTSKSEDTGWAQSKRSYAAALSEQAPLTEYSTQHLFSKYARVGRVKSINSIRQTKLRCAAVLGRREGARSINELLLVLWKRTRNVARVLDEADALHDTFLKHKDEAASYELRVALLEFFIAADQADAATELAAELYKSSLCGRDVLLLSAALSAKEADWRRVLRLIDTASRHSIASFSPVDISRIDKIIYMHLCKEGPERTWDFIDDLVLHKAFVPSEQTHLMMLESFVEREMYEFLPRWVEHTKRLGFPFSVNGKHAANLVRRFYHRHHPPRSYMESLCRYLSRSHTNLAGTWYSSVMKHAIGSQNLGTRTKWGLKLETIAVGQKHLARVEHEHVYAPYIEADKTRSPTTGRVHDQLLLLFSHGRWQDVIELYESSLNTSHIPVSMAALESALNASIKLHGGDASHAQSMLNEAWRHGVNRACGEDIITINRIETLPRTMRQYGSIINAEVEAYNDLASRNGQIASPKVYITAAKCLIEGGLPKTGLALLQKYFSSWSANPAELSPVAMGAFLRGFALSGSYSGMKWVVDTMLQHDLRMSAAFIDVLARLPKLWDKNHAQIPEAEDRRPLLRNHALWETTCRARRLQQKNDARTYGHKLIDSIIACVRIIEPGGQPITKLAGPGPNPSLKWEIKFSLPKQDRTKSVQEGHLSIQSCDPKSDAKSHLGPPPLDLFKGRWFTRSDW